MQHVLGTVHGGGAVDGERCAAVQFPLMQPALHRSGLGSEQDAPPRPPCSSPGGSILPAAGQGRHHLPLLLAGMAQTAAVAPTLNPLVLESKGTGPPVASTQTP